ncbi:sigma 54-interacting transcriptional regulator [Sorangium sp. So ce117]|uniref:sigma 54-interacting transcriptional regulator n=1 Tax=Sorangium sp. So ce117 TaxID=3133277 RepID=UPI003F5E20AD
MPGSVDSSTLSASGGPQEPRCPGRGPCLFLVLESHRPFSPPARVSLDAIDEVRVGRGSARSISAAADTSARWVDIRLDDRWLSSKHARVIRILGRWTFEDCGSKNGSSVNGTPQSSAVLADGDLIELGRTFFIFREALASEHGDATIAAPSPAAAPAPGLVSVLPEIAALFERLALVARSPLSILLHGETGTGKEVMARAVHALSGRPGELVAVNCGALPRDLVEAELFGHRKGAFSGAIDDRPGLVRNADRGTLFLDEIGDLPLPAQTVLLRVLQEREVRPVGGARAVPVDVRVVAATHRPLVRMIAAGEFRADLYARLAGHTVELPALRSRREDLGLIAGALLGRMDPVLTDRLQIHPRAARALLMYRWPGNVRELDQCLTSALVLAHGGGTIDLEHLPAAIQQPGGEAGAADLGDDEARRDALMTLLREHRGNIASVARAMGKARMQIQRWMKRYGLDPDAFRR